MISHAVARSWFALVLVLGLTVSPPLAAQAQAADQSLTSAATQGRSGHSHLPAPAGWSVATGRHVTQVTWHSSQPVPLTDAPVEFRLGDKLLGTPRPAPDGHTFTLRLAGSLPGATQSLRVTRGGLALGRDGTALLPSLSRTLGSSQASVRSTSRTAMGVDDPGVPGKYETTTSEYSLPGLSIDGLPYDVEVQGVVVRPVRSYGARPLVLFLHGRHSTCFRGGPDGRSSGDWPCPANWEPIPSYRGYLDAQELLASQGYVTVSISANGINGQDWRLDDGGAQARAALVRHHLARFARWSTSGGQPFGDDLVGAVDLNNVMLVGHSRGGEGTNRAAVDSAPSDPWRIDSQVLIGPTAFGRQTAPGVDTEVILPYCDGDVSDLQGQQYVDQARDLSSVTTDPALRSAVMVLGANHNFFNLEWTPGVAAAPAWDDWGGRDSVCGKQAPGRLTATEQRTVGAVYIAAAAKAFLDDDASALRLLDGSRVKPASIGDAATLTTALGANRTPLLLPRAGTELDATGVSAVVCRGYRLESGQQTCAPGLSSWSQPHFLRMYGAYSAPPSRAIRLNWQQAGGRVTVPLSSPVDLAHSTGVELRVALDPRSDRAKLGVVIGDGSGHVANLGVQTLHALPTSRYVSKLWAQTVRLPLPLTSAIDLQDIRWIRLVGESGHGRVVVLDAFGRAPGVSEVVPPTLPRINVIDSKVKEGDNGAHMEAIHLEVSGKVTGSERIYVETQNYSGEAGPSGSVIQLTPGQSHVKIEVPIDGDLRDDYDWNAYATVKALSGIVTGDYSGSLKVVDDDPAPDFIVERTASAVVEGDELHWVVRLSAPSDKWVSLIMKPLASGDAELTLADLPPRFRRQHGLPNDDREVPLSSSHLRLWAEFRPGKTAADLLLPIRIDELVEPIETVTLVQKMRPADIEFDDQLTGTVTDE